MMLVNLTATATPFGPGPNRRTKRQPKWLGKRFDRAQTQNGFFKFTSKPLQPSYMQYMDIGPPPAPPPDLQRPEVPSRPLVLFDFMASTPIIFTQLINYLGYQLDRYPKYFLY